jgi:dTDP-4-dehydrorhamnose 3,5-epimerase
MAMDISETSISGCYEITLSTFSDNRGNFIKTFNREIFEENSLEVNFSEQYYSISHKRVLRGLHFQIPPKDHVKLVHCISGDILDVVFDLRKDSPSFGRYKEFRLNAKNRNLIYIPSGLAHGFYVLSDNATVIYNTSTTYSPDHDSGILWNSIGYIWPDDKPIISMRDSGFVPFSAFESPF